MKKKIIMALVALVMALGFCLNVSAAAVPISPLWTNTQSVTLNLSFSNGTANASGVILGQSNTASISASFSLKELNSSGSYVTTYTWPTKYATGTLLTFSGSTSATQGKTYRLYVTAVVTNTSGSAESVTSYVQATY
jgi:hypothetical protein